MRMNVYLMTEDGLELIGHTSLPEGEGDEYIVDLAIAGTGSILRLTYELRTVPRLTAELKLQTELAVVLSLGQTPHFLPGWERVGG
jgi:hypothetical protein